ncbi:sugar ABC transporter substrate-binding protein [Bacillus taeanensis]|uniref:sugar ABC transporter substrate-binding protein n=1 Tax=Bacillus taeanensis TaxID=273032 RepID=UPI0015F11E64|nr:sugar ABC transporter substrate-binding protein [Bacillus taeanensis]
MKKRLLLLVMIFTFSAILIGFVLKVSGNEKPKVVVVLKDLDTQYWEIVKGGAEKGFRDFNIDGKIVAPSYQSEEETQEELLPKILKENPDLLIISPIGSTVIPMLKEFVKKDIPVLLLDTNDPWEGKTAYIGTDNLNLGRKAGALLASELQPGDEVAIIAGDISVSPIKERVAGAKASLEGAGIKIATEKLKLPNEPLPVKKEMREILQTNPNVKGVFATTDIMAVSALEAIKEQGYHMPVIGADGIIEMIELIKEGTLTGTVAQNPYDMGYIGVETALKVLNGKKVEKNIDSGVDIITEDNAAQKLEFLEKLLR